MRKLALAALLLLAGCGEDEPQPWLGYAEADNAFISAPEAGWISKLTVERGAWVKKGDLLFTLDATSQVATRDQANAAIAVAQGQLVAANANLVLTQKELARQAGLMKADAGTKQNYDIAKSNYDTARAQVAQIEAQEANARASLTGAAYLLSERDIISRTEGRVQDIYFRPGEYAPAMTPVVSVLPPKNIYIRFFVPETEFARLKLGQKVAINCDSCAANITATVTFIAQQEEFTPPVIFSIGSRDKLVFKAEARAPDGLKLNPGQPVDVRLL